MKGHLGVVGDSFTCINQHWALEDHFSHQLGQHLDMPVTCLGRGGADMLYIHTQMKYAVEELNVTHLVIWCTSSDRFLFPIHNNPDVPNGPLTANKIQNEPCMDETPYEYSNYDPKFVSDHSSSIDWRHIEKHMTEWKDAYSKYLLHLYDPAIQDYNKQIIMENMYHYCDKNKVKTVIVNMYDSPIDVKPSEYVTYLNAIHTKLYLPGDRGSIPEESPNHMDKPGHINLSNYLKSYFI